MQFQQVDISLEILSECSAALDPVTAIEVLETVDGADFGTMNVSADHPFDPRLAGHAHHRLLVLRHVSHRALGLELQVGRDGPVTESHTAPEAVEMKV